MSCRILYIDDNRANLVLIESIIARLRPRWRVQVEIDPERGLRTAIEGSHDLILLDIQFKETSGYEILSQLREHAHIASVPVIALSASAMEVDIIKAKKAGFYDYVTKPIEVTSLLKLLDRCLTP